MQSSIYTIKRRGRMALEGAMGPAVGAALIEFALTMGGAYLAGGLFSGTGLLDRILYQVFAFLLSLITSVISAGRSYMYLNIYRKKEYSLKDLLYFFQNHPDRVIVASLVLSLIQLATMTPLYRFQFTAVVGESLEAQSTYLMTTLVLVLVSQIVYLILTVPFVLSYYLLADDRNMGGLESLQKSLQLMRGAKMKFLLLLLSFAPMLLLSAFLFYAPLLWVVPHLLMCEAAFYELRLHPETDLPDQRWPRQAPSDYMNPYLGEEQKAVLSSWQSAKEEGEASPEREGPSEGKEDPAGSEETPGAPLE